MSFLTDIQELKSGLIIFRRSDVQHQNWYCRVRVPESPRYKTIALRTSDINLARDRAFDHEADIRFRVKHAVPVFERAFEAVADEFLEEQKTLVALGQITDAWHKVRASHIKSHLIPYVGALPIAAVGIDKFRGYPAWRSESATGRRIEGRTISGSTLRHEMNTLRSILEFAATKGYIRDIQIPKDRIKFDKGRREAFSPEEYRKLHRHARRWLKAGGSAVSKWTRTVVYNYMLIMTNTGMRTVEARNLRWRDISVRADAQGRAFLSVKVRGKKKHRELIAPPSVGEYFERVRALSKATEPEDAVFTRFDGAPATEGYKKLINDLLKSAGLVIGPEGTARSAYSFRHTYATFRLMEGVDVYFLAKQMGTSVQMIEDHYGHVTPSTSTDQILQGMPGWQAVPQPVSDTRNSEGEHPQS
ncbi:MAG: tyrosine-type recombinase/integrase [Rhodospirillaceae bacterium]